MNAVGQFDVCDIALDVCKVDLLGLSFGRSAFLLPLQGMGRGQGGRAGKRGGEVKHDEQFLLTSVVSVLLTVT